MKRAVSPHTHTVCFSRDERESGCAREEKKNKNKNNLTINWKLVQLLTTILMRI
jgi:hypothetical protein